MQSCASVVTKECIWVKEIRVTDGDVITRPTAEQIVAHNRKVRELCDT